MNSQGTLFKNQQIRLKMFPFTSNEKSFEKIDPTRLEPYVYQALPDYTNISTLLDICQEIVRDQLGRGLKKTEMVSLWKTDDSPHYSKKSLTDHSLTVVFFYRKHIQIKKRGATHDKVTGSLHVICLIPNHLGGCVEIRAITSVDMKQLAEIVDTDQFVADLQKIPSIKQLT